MELQASRYVISLRYTKLYTHKYETDARIKNNWEAEMTCRGILVLSSQPHALENYYITYYYSHMLGMSSSDLALSPLACSRPQSRNCLVGCCCCCRSRRCSPGLLSSSISAVKVKNERREEKKRRREKNIAALSLSLSS